MSGKRKLLASLLSLMMLASLGSITLASNNNEAFEFERFYSGGTDGTFTLTYLGRGCPATNDPNDYVFRINVNRSFPRSDWKMFSNNTRYQRTPSGRPIYGFRLDTASAYICVGTQEFSPILHPWSYWTPSGVQSNVYTWRR